MKQVYDIVWALDFNTLVSKTQIYLDNGWICQGGVVVDNGSIRTLYLQSMVKTVEGGE